MRSITFQLVREIKLKGLLIDIIALTFIYFVPTLSHLMNVPVYLIEPMRLMLVIAMVHTSRTNAYILAFTLPIFSYMVSGHPILLKMILISFELVVNVFIFYWLAKRVKHTFVAIFASIVLSKAVYYGLKFGMISFALIGGSVVSTPLTIQLITALIYSIYLAVFFRKVMG